MDTEKYREKLMSYLCNEMHQTERAEFEVWLAKHKELQDELDQMRITLGTMARSLEHEPPQLVFASPQAKGSIVHPLWSAMAGAAACLLAVLMFNFSKAPERAQASLIMPDTETIINAVLDSLGKKEQQPIAVQRGQVKGEKLYSEADMTNFARMLKEENARQIQRFMKAMMMENEKQLDETLGSFAAYLQQERKKDFQRVASELEHLKQASTTKFNETDYALGELLKTVGYQNR